MATDIRVIGGGLAGSEAALTLARLGFAVELWEMRPVKPTDVHESDLFGELVCSNSLGSDALRDARGLLKAELRELGSYVIRCADASRIPAGKAFAVDKTEFARNVTKAVLASTGISIRREEYLKLDPGIPTIVATGPLTSQNLLDDLRNRLGHDNLFFYDAVAPSVWAHSIDRSFVFAASRGGDASDYLNCVLSHEEYYAFVHELQNARQHLPEMTQEQKYFEACLPVEEIARRGDDALRFGPMRPVGLEGRPPNCYAVIQLRRENRDGSVLGLVGFQTSLAIGEQHRVLRTVPALRHAEFVRYGLIHKNAFLRAPQVLSSSLELVTYPRVWITGQLCGVDGYVESTAMGFVAAISAVARLLGRPMPLWNSTTMIGLLLRYVTSERADFQPTNANFGLVPTVQGPRQKPLDRQAFAAEALAQTRRIVSEIDFLAKQETP